MTHEFYLLSIIPNQHTRLKLQSLRHQLFQVHGLASAVAFEPVIPLAWFEAPVDSGGYARFSSGAGGLDNTVTESKGKAPQTANTPQIEFGDPMLWGGHLYISVVVQPENLLQKLINTAGQAPISASLVSAAPIAEKGVTSIPEAGAPPIPAAEGIILAANEQEIANGGKPEAGHREQANLLQTAAYQIEGLTQYFPADRSLK